MSSNTPNDSWRRLPKMAATGALLAPFAKFTSQSAYAGSHEKRTGSDNLKAKALQYVHVATESTSPLYKDGSICGNCIQWKGGDAERGQCVLFAGVVVANAGWCSAWTKRWLNSANVEFFQKFLKLFESQGRQPCPATSPVQPSHKFPNSHQLLYPK